jgi:alkylation response protein AidB-like acyl-CoA dehydrogenase
MHMDFTAAEKAFEEQVAAFVAENLPQDIKTKVDRGIELTRDEIHRWMRILGKQGWAATNWDKKDGGPGFTVAQKFLTEDAIFMGGAPKMVHFGTRMVGPVLLAFGSEEQKAKYIPKILTSEEVWCQGYSEPQAGSDLAQLQCAAVRDGDNYVVNGTKIWTSSAHFADRMFALVRTSKEPKKQDGISCLLIDLKTPGIEIRPIFTVDGKHHFNQEFFTDVRVPVSDRVGEEGEGWKIAKFLLGHERSNATYVSMNKRNLKKLSEIANDQRADGERLIDEPDFARKLADLKQAMLTTTTMAMRQLAAASADKPVGPEASIMKIRVMDAYKECHELMMEAGAYYAQPFERSQIRGESNASWVGPDYLYRMSPDYFESRAMSIAGGSHEIQKDILAKRALGL